jgi:hypothetical protein
MQESALIALAVAAVLVAVLAWAYFKGKLNSFLPASLQHTPASAPASAAAAAAPPAKGTFVGAPPSACGAY